MKDKLAAAEAVLAELAEPNSVGEFLGEFEVEKKALELRFDCTLRGYRNWYWSVVFSQLDKRKESTISEVQLLAGEGALLAPAWVPWAERLAEFRKQLRESGRAATDAEADELIRDMTSAFGNHGEANEAEGNSDQGSVKPPLKTRVRQRRIKRTEDSQDDNPAEGAQ